MKTDFLVIGSGAAGLSFALKAAAHGHVTIVTKGEMNECNTNFAQGGICSVTYAPDTFEKHIHDTLVCGAGKCDEEAVGLVVRRAPELIRDLIEWGTRFDRTPDGRFELNREGGHTEPRILHHEDLTGAEIERALVESVRRHPGITVLEHHFAIDLLTQHHLGEFVTRHTRGLACFGAYVLNLATNEIETMLAKFTVVATGGCGNIYSTTSNPVVATGGDEGITAVASAPWGSAMLLPITYGYIKMLGGNGLRRATEMAIVNANYMSSALAPEYRTYYSGETGRVGHEMILDLTSFKKDYNIDCGDIAHRLMDYGFHAPTLSFPVHETLMVEPTESEPKAEMDRFIEALVSIKRECEAAAGQADNVVANAPHTAVEIAGEWTHPYTRAEAAFPLAWVREAKFFPYVTKIDNGYGDRNLCCRNCE